MDRPRACRRHGRDLGVAVDGIARRRRAAEIHRCGTCQVAAGDGHRSASTGGPLCRQDGRHRRQLHIGELVCTTSGTRAACRGNEHMDRPRACGCHGRDLSVAVDGIARRRRAAEVHRCGTCQVSAGDGHRGASTGGTSRRRNGRHRRQLRIGELVARTGGACAANCRDTHIDHARPCRCRGRDAAIAVDGEARRCRAAEVHH
ncbi:hypothetical protein SDC9_167573 [bioreactor metagenome]|uniref:Uncharacterized protein n=1 Tax=bioreactor metagenome TaxID=1076179 RepID=A0A645G0P5_9ZZZZ